MTTNTQDLRPGHVLSDGDLVTGILLPIAPAVVARVDVDRFIGGRTVHTFFYSGILAEHHTTEAGR